MPTMSFTLHLRRLPLYIVCPTLLLQICFSQVPDSNGQAKEVLRWSDTEQREFVKSVMDREFPQNDGDRFSVLLVNRSSLVVPMLEAKLEQELKLSPRSARFVELASAMIAYAGDEQSLRAISKLIAIDDNRFGRLVGRTLDNALSFGNPFTVAYRGYEIGDAILARHIAVWSEGSLSSARMQRLFAEAMIAEYGREPSDGEWTIDPIASRIRVSQRQELKENVIRFAREAIAKRERYQ